MTSYPLAHEIYWCVFGTGLVDVCMGDQALMWGQLGMSSSKQGGKTLVAWKL
jgi:hypothetical protein